MTRSRAQSNVTDLWGWETFFAELGHFLESSGRNFVTTSEPYALERLEMCIISLNVVKVGALTTTNDANHEMFHTYCGQVEEILCIC